MARFAKGLAGMFRWAAGLAGVVALCLSLHIPARGADVSSDASADLSRGAAAMREGAFDQAAAAFSKAAAAYQDQGKPGLRAAALADLAAAYCSLGQYPLAINSLRSAGADARAVKDARQAALLDIRLAQTLALARTDEMAMSYAPEANALLDHSASAAASDPAIQAAASAARGDVDLAYRRPERAADDYAKALEFADSVGDTAASARDAANAAVAALAYVRQMTSPDRTRDPRPSVRRKENVATTRATALGRAMNGRAIESAARLAPSHDTAYLWLTLGQTDEGLAFAPPSEPLLRMRAFTDYRSGLAAAKAVGDVRAQAYAAGYTGHLYEIDGRNDEALALTRRAVFLAQKVRDSDCLYRWQWQTGRLLRARADAARARGDEAAARAGEADALAAYRRAVATLQDIRADVAAGGGNQPSSGSFRGVAEGIYYELADLILRQADAHAADQAVVQHDLLEARDTVEQLKTAQVADYFHERCNALLEKKGIEIDSISPTTAVVYLIPLRDRTEILIAEPAAGGVNSTGTHVRRFRAEVSEKELTAAVREFRLDLTDAGSNNYAVLGKKLYHWLITPMDEYLNSRHVDTLVFVPDGALRTIPMSALYDGEHFLVEKYAVAVSPGLKLTEPRPLSQSLTESRVRLLTSGLSAGSAGFAALPSVKAELSNLHDLYGGRELLDQDFTVKRFDGELTDNDYSVVHIASHGQFGDDPYDTFVLAYNGRLDLNHLEMLIEPSKFKGRPVELLTLSACETAAGDDRAALGLAGVALKAGARSALATLWQVSDVASARVIADFYGRLKKDPRTSKAQALRQAQLQLIQDKESPQFRHPAYWGPYLIIGNWL